MILVRPGIRPDASATPRGETGPVIVTDRLALRHIRLDDAQLVLDLLNQPSFLRFVGDRGVRTLDDAREYIRKGPLESYERLGFGLYVVELEVSSEPIGVCGLLKRPALEDVGLGFAMLPRFWSRGYASEAAAAVLEHARGSLGMSRIIAIVDPENRASIRVLERIGMAREGTVRLAGEEPELLLFAVGREPTGAKSGSIT